MVGDSVVVGLAQAIGTTRRFSRLFVQNSDSWWITRTIRSTGPADDHKRFMRLFLAHEPEILRCVLVFVPHRTDARDIVQETAVALWKHFRDYDPERSFANWACGFARIEIRRFLRRMHRRAALSETAAEAMLVADEVAAETHEQRERHLAECMAQLPPRQRRLVEGYYFEEAEVASLAREHGHTVEAVYKALQRIRRVLLDCLERKSSAGSGYRNRGSRLSVQPADRRGSRGIPRCTAHRGGWRFVRLERRRLIPWRMRSGSFPRWPDAL